MTQRVLVTGSAGGVGRWVCRELGERGYFIRAFDVLPTPDDRPADERIVGDVADADDVHRAVDGMDVVVHLGSATFEDDFLTRLAPTNIVGVHNVFESVREAGIARIVMPSSCMVAWGHPWNRRRISMADGVAPTTHYALTKLNAEQMGRMYHDLHGIHFVFIRLSWMPIHAANVKRVTVGPHTIPDVKTVYLSPPDTGRLFAAAIETPAERFGGFMIAYANGVSDYGFDNEDVTRLLGWEPQHAWPEGMPEDWLPA